MTVRELIERLQDYNQDFPVVLARYSSGEDGKLITVLLAVSDVYPRHKCIIEDRVNGGKNATDAVVVIGEA